MNIQGWLLLGLTGLISLLSKGLSGKTMLLFSHSVESNSLWCHGLQRPSLPCPSPTPRAFSNSCPSSRWCHPTISSSVIPFSSCLQSFQHEGLFQQVSSLHQVAKPLELQHHTFQWTFRTEFPYNWLLWSPHSPRDSQESCPLPQFERISSLALSICYGATLTFVHDY